MTKKNFLQNKLDHLQSQTLKNWDYDNLPKYKKNVALDCGWGRLLFGQTFEDNEKLAKALRQEEEGCRDIAFYIRDPHVITALGPQEFFLDPSHTYRLWLDKYQFTPKRPKGFFIRKIYTDADIKKINSIYGKLGMAKLKENFFQQKGKKRTFTALVAETEKSGEVVGAAIGIDHVYTFKDPENGTSIWSLAVDPQATCPGIGITLLTHLIGKYHSRGRSFVDLSVMHSNKQAIALYDKLGFERVPIFCIKHKNSINEKLFMTPNLEERLNPYAQIIIDEARRRGIDIEILDVDNAIFKLTFGGRSIICKESLTELTNAIAFQYCDDKQYTYKLLQNANLCVGNQQTINNEIEAQKFLEKHRQVVIKPARGEQGKGISIDIRDKINLNKAIKRAKKYSEKILIEKYIKGIDLRIVVINFKVTAAAVRVPPKIIGTGKHTIRQLIQKQSRRRSAATKGESKIPIDSETKRCISESNLSLKDILTRGQELIVRQTANLHTGGTMHDVTDKLNNSLRKAAEKAAIVLNIPVVGFDFFVDSVEKENYIIIEANERPGFANHEPQPLVEIFMNFLFPNTKK